MERLKKMMSYNGNIGNIYKKPNLRECNPLDASKRINVKTKIQENVSHFSLLMDSILDLFIVRLLKN